jgi:hypothetical protein
VSSRIQLGAVEDVADPHGALFVAEKLSQSSDVLGRYQKGVAVREEG